MSTSIVGRLAVLRDPVVRNSAAIMGSTLVTSGLGFIFWLVVARVADPTTSGTGAAFASGVQLLALVASVGAAAALVEWLPKAHDDREWRQLVTVGTVTAMTTSLVGAAFLVGSTAMDFPIVPGLDRPMAAILFVASAVLFSVGTVLDYVCVSQNRGLLLLGRNTVMCGLRVPIFVLLFTSLGGTNAIFWSWTVAVAISVVQGWVMFGRRGDHTLEPDVGQWREHLWNMRHSLVGQHLITVTAMLPGYLLPLIVVARLDAAQNAYFYITWMLGSVFFMVSPAVSTALFAAASNHGVNSRQVLRSLGLIFALLTVPILVYLVGGRWLLAMFGADYARAGTTLLIVLTLSAIPDAITNVAVAVLRASGRMPAALCLNAGMAAVVLVGAWVMLPSAGIEAVGWWWLAAQTLGALTVLATWRWIVSTGPTEAEPRR